MEAQTETPGQKTMRRFYEGRLVERLMLATDLAQSRAMLRRGARKQQDGTLGQSVPGDSQEDEPMQIRIGDDIHVGGLSTPQPAANQPSTPAATAATTGPSGWAQNLGRAAVVAAGLLGAGGLGAGIPWLAGAYSRQAVTNITQPVQASDQQRLGVEVVPGGAMP